MVVQNVSMNTGLKIDTFCAANLFQAELHVVSTWGYTMLVMLCYM